MATPPVTLQITVSQKDVDRITKRLDKWQGAELAKRLEKATQGGLALLVNPIRGQSPVQSGTLRRSVRVSKLRKRAGEATPAYKVGPTARHRHLVIRGTQRGVEANPFVDRAANPLDGQVRSFIDEQVRRIA